MNRLAVLLFLVAIVANCAAQTRSPKKKVLIDVAHGQKFYHDPADMPGKEQSLIDRVLYMTGEVKKNAGEFDREVGFLKTPISKASLKECDLLFIHMPSVRFTPDEVKSIQQYVEGGGSLFLVMEVDYWSTLDQTNVNDIIKPYDIIFKQDNPDQESTGGHSVGGAVTSKRWEIPSHGARIVEGGTPFCFTNKSDEHPLGVYKKVKKGRIIAMGEGMVSLYMTSWKEVDNYPCADFMHDVFGWLLQ